MAASKLIIGHTVEGQTPVETNVDALMEGGLLMTASSGNGKSYTFRKIAELTYSKCQQIIIDPEGEYASLRELKDSNYILAGKDDKADIKINPAMAEMLARKVLELNLSIIIDIYDLKHGSKYSEKREFLAKFINALVDAPKELWGRKCIVMIDEAHQHCPQTTKRFEDTSAKDAIIALSEKGRKRGLRVILATQRLAKLDKDASSELKNQLVGGLNRLDDRKRAAEEIGYDVKKQDELRTIPQGQFIAMGPAFNAKDPVMLKIDKVETKHLKVGEQLTKYMPPITDKVKDILKQLEDLPEQAQQELKTKQDLESEVARLRAEIRKKELSGSKQPVRIVQTPPSQEQIEETKKEGYNLGWRDCWSEWNKFIGAIPNDLSKVMERIEAIAMMRDTLEDVRISLIEKLPSTAPTNMPTINKQYQRLRLKAAKADLDKIDNNRHRLIEPTRKLIESNQPRGEFSDTAWAILKYLAQNHGKEFTKQQMGPYIGYSARSSGVVKAIGKLVDAGYITANNGKYSVASTDQLQAAIATLGSDYEDATTLRPVDWINKLKGSDARLLKAFVDYPPGLSKEEAAENAGISPKSSALVKSISHLIAKGLIQKDGEYYKVIG